MAKTRMVKVQVSIADSPWSDDFAYYRATSAVPGPETLDDPDCIAQLLRGVQRAQEQAAAELADQLCRYRQARRHDSDEAASHGGSD